MKNTSILLFLLILQLQLFAQIDVTGDWEHPSNSSIILSFSRDGELKIISINRSSKTVQRSYQFSRVKNNLYLKFEGAPFDTLSILKKENDLLTIYQKGQEDTLQLINVTELIPDSLFRKFIGFPNLEFRLSDADVPHRIKRGLFYFDINSEENCYTILSWQHISGLLNSYRYFKGPRFGNPREAVRLHPISISKDSLVINLVGQNRKWIVTKTKDHNLSTDSLIGHWIILKDKDKFEASFNESNKKIYIGHPQLQISPNNQCVYTTTQNEPGRIHFEVINGVSYFSWFGDIIHNSAVRRTPPSIFSNIYSFYFVKKLIQVDDSHIILSPLSCTKQGWNNPEREETLYLIKID